MGNKHPLVHAGQRIEDDYRTPDPKVSVLIAASVKRNLYVTDIGNGQYTVNVRGKNAVLFGPAAFQETINFIDQ